MYGHVLPRLGRWEEALEQFEKADAIEVAYARAENLRPGDDWHHLHNLQLMGYTYLRLQRIDDAERTFRRAFDTPASWLYKLSPSLVRRRRSELFKRYLRAMSPLWVSPA